MEFLASPLGHIVLACRSPLRLKNWRGRLEMELQPPINVIDGKKFLCVSNVIRADEVRESPNLRQ